MRCKVFYGDPSFGTLDAAINQWMDSIPGLEIYRVVQSCSATGMTTLTIFYYDGEDEE